MNSVGSLDIAATYCDGAFSGLTVRLERPPVASLFVGQAPVGVVKLVPCLYTLCSQAQSAAARAALAAAAGEGMGGVDSAALWAESLHEHFWRLLLDWPVALGLPQAKDAFIAWRAARGSPDLAGATLSLLQDVLLGEPGNPWQDGMAPTAASLVARCLARLEGTENTRHFSPAALTPADWLAYWRGSDDLEPDTVVPASVAAAWRSRLDEALRAARGLAEGTPYPVAGLGSDGWGIGQALTARGVLTHGARIENGVVTAYQIWAPTDRHFADAGPLRTLLQNGPWPDREGARRAVEQAVLALDPCLPYTVKVDNA